MHLFVFRQYAPPHLGPEVRDPLSQLRILASEHLGDKDCSVGRAGLADRHGGDRNTWWHLHCGVETVHAGEGVGLDGHSDDGHLPDGQLAHAPKESPLVVTIPLVLLAIPSVLIGWFTIGPVLFGGWLDDSITVHEANNVLAELGHHYHGATAMALHAIQTLPFWLTMAGFVITTYVYRFNPTAAERFRQRVPVLHRLLEHKYYFDEIYQKVFAEGSVKLGQGLWRRADAGLIDGWLVNGSGRLVNWMAKRVRLWQTGYLYDYAFAMILGLIAILGVWVVRF